MFPSPFARLFGMVSAPFATNNTVTKGTKLSKNRTVIKKLSFATPGLCRLIFDYCGAIFALPESLFIDYSGAKYTRFIPKSPLCRSHFFEWLKAAISSNACGMSTLKSLLPQAFAVSDVHPRPRKRLARCTLDCGFKTSESPALRGFVGGLRALATAALYLVLKSNGFRHSKNLPVKFGFLPKTTSTNIAKKLPSQRCFKPLLIALFNFSHKRLTFAFVHESGYTLGFRRKIAHKGTHGETGGAFGGGWYHYPRSVPHVSETLRGQGVERQTLPLLGLGRGCSRRTQKAFGTAMRLCVSLSRRRRGPAGLRDLFHF